ncbi:MAG TPA: 5'/3'-nucleotidase SurE [Thermodesulfobacteriota bacterium]|nr:hypothetical protein [Deltaproteobacteria bacterium]HNR14305.1 5'/3'-nucleotidase SurE [Thermodesulfobacteriota bacterium]HNU72025.1 5'/3'-nucleotidase SurE [Thermodesulfobacteriota bacterium]HQO78146.1 5'/3'-nucleotidase SurE [Thermodesulfobacteriota bacterium]
MKKMRILVILMVIALAPGFFCEISLALTILLTNDDGYNAPGIQAMHAALQQAGHSVTIVAPKENWSSNGGAITNPLDSGGFTTVTVLREAPDVWSVAGTPADSVGAGLGAIMVNNPPDLLVSGANFSENTGQPASSYSGTINAAIAGCLKGVPAIAVSVQVDALHEFPHFTSTYAAFPSAGVFTARLIERLAITAAQSGGSLLPKGTILNVTIPVPYESIKGVRQTNLASSQIVNIVWKDVWEAVPQGGGPVLVTAEVAAGPDPVPYSDTDAYLRGFISITLIDVDMTADRVQQVSMRSRLAELEP